MAEPFKIIVQINEKVYLKNPESSELGNKIINESILMIGEIGFEAFTFKKLAKNIGSTEPSIYRYFENKQKLLLYLLLWYWNWMEYKLAIATANIPSPEERLRISIKLLSEPIEKDQHFNKLNEAALYKIVIAESSKAYLNKEVDNVNRDGLFLSYKRLCKKVAEIINEINPEYRFPKALVSTLVESSHNQKFFAEHLPSLTEVTMQNLDTTTDFLTEMALKTIKKQ